MCGVRTKNGADTIYIKCDEPNLFFLMIYEAINCFGHLKIFFLFECEAIVENLSIFLNEFNGISNTPKQMRHAENSRDKCTIDNCVFFLSIQKRIENIVFKKKMSEIRYLKLLKKFTSQG